MEAVLGTALRVCVCKLMSGVLLFPLVVTHTVSAVSVCCCCLLLFTELSITLFLLSLWLMDPWTQPFSVSSDVVALRVLLFLCDLYGPVLLLTPPLMAVEMLLKKLWTEDGRAKALQEPNESLSGTVGVLGCFLAWLVSATYCSQDGALQRVLVENCLREGGCLVSCLPDGDESFWLVTVAMLLLSLVGLIGTKASEHTQMEEKEGSAVLERLPVSLCPDSEESLLRAGFVYSEPRIFCPGNDVLHAHQTGWTGEHILKQKPTSCAVLARSDAALLPERCLFKSREKGSPVPEPHTLSGLLCVVLLCSFPTLLSCNVLLIFTLENLVAFSLRLLSQSVNRGPDL